MDELIGNELVVAHFRAIRLLALNGIVVRIREDTATTFWEQVDRHPHGVQPHLIDTYALREERWTN